MTLLCLADAAIPAPANVKTRRIADTVMETTWDAPTTVSHSSIAGYRIHYRAVTAADAVGPPADAERWRTKDTGPVNVTEVNFSFRASKKVSRTAKKLSTESRSVQVHACRARRAAAPRSGVLLVLQVLAGEELFVEAEIAQIADAHGI